MMVCLRRTGDVAQLTVGVGLTRLDRTAGMGLTLGPKYEHTWAITHDHSSRCNTDEMWLCSFATLSVRARAK